jgi:asparagine synthase (glutamine-hydrolysing)
VCGIGGYAARIDGAAAPDPQLFARALAHRGPDSDGTATGASQGSSWSLSHTRLAIVDLSAAGNQPMANEDDTLWMSFNGEIYNAPELRSHCEARGHRFRSHSDGEVILHLWELEGPSCLHRLNGIYAFAIGNRATGEVFLVRDPVGVKPLFYVDGGDQLWFASELRALHEAGAPLGGFDEVAIAQFLTFLWVPDPRTPFVGAKSLLPGHVLHWSGAGARDIAVVDLLAESAEAEQIGSPEAEAEIRDRTSDAIRRQLQADVPLAIMASGGVDSSLIWWAAGQEIDRAYTIDWSEDETPERLGEDTSTVRMLGRTFGTPVAYLDGSDSVVGALPRSGDLFADPAFDLCRRIAERAAADGYKVLLSGQGGDEVFAGYRRHVVGPVAARVPSALPRLLPRQLLSALPSSKLGIEYGSRALRAASQTDPLASYLQLCTYSSATDRAKVLDATEREVSDDVVWERHRAVFDALPRSWSLLRRFRAVDFAVYLPGLGLAYADRAGMAHGVEIRVPWVDVDLVRWALRLEDRALVRSNRSKWLTRQLSSEVLPSWVAKRPKRGFAVPAAQVAKTHGAAGERGFRQSAYLASAAAILEAYRADPFTDSGSADRPVR